MLEPPRPSPDAGADVSEPGGVLGSAWRAWLAAITARIVVLEPEPGRRHLLLTVAQGDVRADLVSGAKRELVGRAAGTSAEQTGEFRAAVARHASGRTPVRIRLARDQVIERSMRFPLAVGDVLRPVLSNQLQRLVPWSDDDLCFGYGAAAAADNPDQLAVNVVATSRKRVDEAVGLARHMGLEPDAVDYASDAAGAPGGRIVVLADLREHQRTRLAGRIDKGVKIFSVLAVVTGLAGGAYAWERQRSLDLITAETTLLRTELAAMDKAGGRPGGAMEGPAAITERKATTPAAVRVLGELTRALPDHSWLSNVTLSGDSLGIIGRSRDAASLIGALERSPRFADVRFSAPTVRDGDTGQHMFSISARIVARSEPQARKP